MPERLWWSNTGWALVRERMPYYQSKPAPNPQFKSAPGFDPQWAWTGDQGLIIGGLVGQCIRKHDPELITRAEELLNGVQRFLVNQSVLNNWTTTGKLPSIPPRAKQTMMTTAPVAGCSGAMRSVSGRVVF